MSVVPNLALSIVLAAAVITGSVSMIRVAYMRRHYGVPHWLYHLTARNNLATSDLIAVIGSLTLSAALPLLILWAAANRDAS
ncbi:MAG: hypothetical protein R2706_21095 [Acidimicrobiales bacterium]